MSEHEGFGVPLVESMLMRVPVLAYAATAVPFTLGGAGVQFTREALRGGGGDRPRPGHGRGAARARSSPGRTAGSPPSRRRRSRPRCGRTWSPCERTTGPRSPSSSSATARASPAARSRSRARWPSAWPAEHRITVFTTCARDYVTWRNELPEGRERLGGVEVLRFPVEEERDLAAFNAFAEPLYARERTHDEEIEFLRRQGPARAAARRGAAGAEGPLRRRRLLHLPLLPDLLGPRGRPRARRARAHDPRRAAAALLRSTARSSRAPRAFGFLTPAEEALVRARFDVGERPGVPRRHGRRRAAARPDVAGFRARHGLDAALRRSTPGRIDAGKGCAEMLAHHERYRREQAGARRPRPHRPARDARAAAGRACATSASSPRRRRPRPWPARGRSSARAPTRASRSCCSRASPSARPASSTRARPCSRSTACARTPGLFYADGDEYVEALDLLVREPRLRDGARRERPPLRGGGVPLGRGARPLAGAAASGRGGAPPRPRQPFRSRRTASATALPLRMPAARAICWTASSIASGPAPRSISPRARR